MFYSQSGAYSFQISHVEFDPKLTRIPYVVGPTPAPQVVEDERAVFNKRLEILCQIHGGRDDHCIRPVPHDAAIEVDTVLNRDSKLLETVFEALRKIRTLRSGASDETRNCHQEVTSGKPHPKPPSTILPPRSHASVSSISNCWRVGHCCCRCPCTSSTTHPIGVE